MGKITLAKDAAYGDSFHDVSKKEKRIVRLTTKTFEKTGKYHFLKVFKDDGEGNFLQEQFVSMTADEVAELAKYLPKVTDTKTTKSATNKKLAGLVAAGVAKEKSVECSSQSVDSNDEA